MGGSTIDLSDAATTYTAMLPKTAVEYERLDAQARAMTTMIGGRSILSNLHEACAKQDTDTFTAVDIGCGTGFTTAELGSELQRTRNAGELRCKVYGVDLASVPAVYERPENVDFVQGNIGDLAGADPRFLLGSFDFVFHRNLLYAIPDWLTYIRTCLSLLKPGGRAEFQDASARYLDISGAEISKDWKWLNMLHNITAKVSLDILAGEHIRNLMVEAGFVDVEEKAFSWHVVDEHWEGHPELDDIGRYSSRVLYPQFPTFLANLAQRAGMGDEDLAEVGGLDGLKSDYSQTLARLPKGTHVKFYVITGRKP